MKLPTSICSRFFPKDLKKSSTGSESICDPGEHSVSLKFTTCIAPSLKLGGAFVSPEERTMLMSRFVPERLSVFILPPRSSPASGCGAGKVPIAVPAKLKCSNVLPWPAITCKRLREALDRLHRSRISLLIPALTFSKPLANELTASNETISAPERSKSITVTMLAFSMASPSCCTMAELSLQSLNSTLRMLPAKKPAYKCGHA
mmetsp:Transcript_354/g.678  ORF Transcript_354/g.678 Transcript_354/m.678 type:complete len:204 (+) Transcript_354:3705-4316(+)